MSHHPEPSRFAAWYETGAVLISYAAFVLSEGGRILLPMLGFAVLSSHLVSARLPKGWWLTWGIRLSVYIVTAVLVITDPEMVRFNLMVMVYFHIAGQLCAIELAMQYWQWPTAVNPRGAVIVFLTGMVMVAAAKTDHSHIFYLTPPYIILIAMTLRRMRRRGSFEGRFLAFSRVVALSCALFVGTASTTTLYVNRDRLTNWFMQFLMKQTTTSFSENPRLEKTASFRQSTTRVLRIGGILNDGHLRGMTFEKYIRGVWNPQLYVRSFATIPPAELNPQSEGPRVAVHNLLDDMQIIFAPLNSAGVDSRGETVEWCREVGPLRNATIVPLPYFYDVVLSQKLDFQGPFCIPPSDEYRQRCLDIPPDIDPRVVELGKEIAARNGGKTAGGETKTALAAIFNVEEFLRTNNEYSMETDPGKDDPISGFILRKKAAHCEYFASAAVMLLRAAHVPARYVSGYSAHETFRRSDGTYETIVRQRDAHAWAEAWVKGKGWVIVEATPPEGLPNNTDLPFWLAIYEWFQDRIAEFRLWVSNLSGEKVAVTVGTIAALAVAWMAWRDHKKKKRGVSFSFNYANPHEALAKLAAEFERFLKQRGVPCPPQRPWREHLAGAATEHAKAPPLDFERALSFAAQYNDVRFGKPEDRVAIDRLIAEFQKLNAGVRR